MSKSGKEVKNSLSNDIACCLNDIAQEEERSPGSYILSEQFEELENNIMGKVREWVITNEEVLDKIREHSHPQSGSLFIENFRDTSQAIRKLAMDKMGIKK